jgi:hypothetical protein
LGVTFQVSSTKAAQLLRWKFAWAAATANVDWKISPSRNSAKAFAAGMGRALGRIGREAVLAARVPVAELIEIL